VEVIIPSYAVRSAISSTAGFLVILYTSTPSSSTRHRIIPRHHCRMAECIEKLIGERKNLVGLFNAFVNFEPEWVPA